MYTNNGLQLLFTQTGYRGKTDVPIYGTGATAKVFGIEFDTTNCRLCVNKIKVRSDAVGAVFDTQMSFTAMQVELAKFSNIGAGNVIVADDIAPSDNLRRWEIKFSGLNVQGNLPNVFSNAAEGSGTLRVIAFPSAQCDNVKVYTNTTIQGNELNGGSFQLTFKDTFGRSATRSTTSSIDWNAPATGAGSVLEKLKELSLVRNGLSVTRTVLPAAGGGFEWAITFGGNDGNLAPLAIEASTRSVVTSNNQQFAHYWVCDGSGSGFYSHPTCIQGTELEGKFILNTDLRPSTAEIFHEAVMLATDATAFGSLDFALESALNGLPSGTADQLSTSNPARYPALEEGWSGGYRWKVTFSGPDTIGDMTALYAGTRSELKLTINSIVLDGTSFVVECPGRAPATYAFASTSALGIPATSIRLPFSASAPEGIVTEIVSFFMLSNRSSGLVNINVDPTDPKNLVASCEAAGPASFSVLPVTSSSVSASITNGAATVPDLFAGYEKSFTPSIYSFSFPNANPFINPHTLIGSALSISCPKPLIPSGVPHYDEDVFEFTLDETSSFLTSTSGTRSLHRIAVGGLSSSVSIELFFDLISRSVTNYAAVSNRVSVNTFPRGVKVGDSANFGATSDPVIDFTCLRGGVPAQVLTPPSVDQNGVSFLVSQGSNTGAVGSQRPAFVSVLTEREGNTVYGQFRLSYGGVTTPIISLPPGGSSEGRFAIESALLSLRDANNVPLLPSVTVTVSADPVTTHPVVNSAGGFKWLVEFTDPATSGVVPTISVASVCTSDRVSVGGRGTCDGLSSRSPLVDASNAVATSIVRSGNGVAGTFALSLGGATTGPLSYDIDEDSLASALQSLSTVGKVVVARDWPSEVGLSTRNGARRYRWTVTFVSGVSVWAGDSNLDWSSGFSRAWGKNVGASNPQLVCLTDKLVDASPDVVRSAVCNTVIIRNATDPVNGYFRLCMDTTLATGLTSPGVDGTAYAQSVSCTSNIRHDAPASRAEATASSRDPATSVEAALELLPSIGDVVVTRSATATSPALFDGGYTWSITFLRDGVSTPCTVMVSEGATGCPSAGNVNNVVVSLPNDSYASRPLTGLSTGAPVVSEVVAGSVVAGTFTLTFTSGILPASGPYPTFTTASLPADATAEEVKAALLNVPGTPIKNVVVSRAPTSVYRTFRWRVTFTDVRESFPWGAGAHNILTIDQLALRSSSSSSVSPAVTAAVEKQGSTGLGGSFALSMDGDTQLPVTLPWNVDPLTLRLVLESFDPIFNVAVTLDRGYGVGWNAQWVDPVMAARTPDAALGGYRYNVTFTRNVGTFDGVSLPAGAGIRPALVASTGTALVGTSARAKARLLSQGSPALSGAVSLSFDGSSPSMPLSYAASTLDFIAMATGVETLGPMLALREPLYTVPIGAARFVTGQSFATSIDGADLTTVIAPGEILRVGKYEAPTLIGHVDVSAGSDLVEFSASQLPVFSRTLKRVQLEAGGRVRIGPLITSPTVTVMSTGGFKATVTAKAGPSVVAFEPNSTFRLVYQPASGVSIYSQCISASAVYDAPAGFAEVGMQSALDALFGPGFSTVAVTHDSSQVEWKITLAGLEDAGRSSLLAVDPSNDLSQIQSPSSTCVCCSGSTDPNRGDSSLLTVDDIGLPTKFQLSGPWAQESAMRVPIFALPALLPLADITPSTYSVIVPNDASKTWKVSLSVLQASTWSPAHSPVTAASWGFHTTASEISADLDINFAGHNVIVTRAAYSYSSEYPSGYAKFTFYYKGGNPPAPVALDTSTSNVAPVIVSAGTVSPVWGGSGDFAFDADKKETLLPLKTPWEGLSTTLPLYRAGGVGFEIQYASSLGPVPLPLVSSSTSSGNGVRPAVRFVNEMDGYAPTTAVIFGLQPGTETFVRVAAKNGLLPNGWSSWSSIASAVPVAPPLAPQALSIAPARRTYEVQRVWATAAASPEIQMITTSADIVSEMQTVRTSAPLGSTISGTFSLSFNGVSTADPSIIVAMTSSVPLSAGGIDISFKVSGSSFTTACINYSASEQVIVAEILKAAPGTALSGDILRVKTAVSTTSLGSVQYAWSFFDSSASFTIDAALNCAAWVPSPSASSPSASVYLNISRPLGASLDWNASASDVAAALQSLPDIEAVQVTRTLAGEEGAYAWSIVYSSLSQRLSDAAIPLSIPRVVCDSTALVVSPSGPASCETITDVHRNFLSGSFYLTMPAPLVSMPPVSTPPLPWNASANDLRDAVTTLFAPTIMPLTVSRSSADASGGYTWTLTFDGVAGDVPLIAATSLMTEATSGLRGAGAAISTSTIVNGSTIGGSFTLRFGPRETRAITYNASAADFAAKLVELALPGIELVRVSRIDAVPDVPTAGAAWDVTFSAPGDMVLGLTVGSTASLTGTGASVGVREVLKGSRESGSALALSLSPPARPGGLPILRYKVEWDTTETFSSADRGEMMLSTSDLLYGTQLVSVVAGVPSGSGCAVSGSWSLSYGASSSVGAPRSRTVALPWDASAAVVRSALSNVEGVAGVSVVREVSKVQLTTPSGEVITASTLNITAPLASTPSWSEVIVSADISSILAVGDAVWIGDYSFSVKQISTDVFNRIVLSLGQAGSHVTAAYIFDFPLKSAPIYRSGFGFTYAITFTGAAAPKALTPAAHSLVCAGAPKSVRVVVSHPPCTSCAYIPASPGTPGAASLLKGRKYYARAWAFNAAGRSEASSIIAAAAPATVPSPPRAAVLTPASDTSLRVSWSSPADDGYKGDQGGAVDSYLIEWDPVSTFSSGVKGMAAGSAVIHSRDLMGIAPPYNFLITSSNGTALTLGSTLFVRVSASNAIGFDSNTPWLTGSQGLYPSSGGQVFESTRAYAATSPVSATTSFQPPGASALVVVKPLSGTSVRISTSLPADDGGKLISGIVLQWASSAAVLSVGGEGTSNLTVPLSLWATAPSVNYSDGRATLPSVSLYELTGLPSGVPVFLRVAAMNAIGQGPWTAAAVSATPLTTPVTPAAVAVRSSLAAFPGEAVSTLEVTWAAPASNGGAPISGYVAEIFSGDAPIYEVQRLTVSNSLGRSDINCVQGQLPTSPACAITLNVFGASTVSFPLDETAANVRAHLLTLKNAAGDRVFSGSAVTVTRAATPQGYTWDITFKGPPNGVGAGDVPSLVVASSTAIGTTYQNSKKNCGAGTAPFAAPFANTCLSVGVATVTQGRALYGKGEVQTITLLASDSDSATYNPPKGFFTIQALGVSGVNDSAPIIATTPLLAFDASPESVAAALVTALGSAGSIRGSVTVTRSVYSNADLTFGPAPGVGAAQSVQALVNQTGAYGSAYDGAVYTITFAAADGDVPMLGLSSSRLSPTIDGASLVSVVSDGSHRVDVLGVPACRACSTGQLPPGLLAKTLPAGATGATFSGLTPGGRYYVTVSAINAVGTGAPALAVCSPSGSTYCSPDLVSGRLAAALPASAGSPADVFGIATPRNVPGGPLKVTTVPHPSGDGDKLLVNFEPPTGSGGADIASYRVEWSAAADFSSGLGRLDVPCAAGAPAAVIAITTMDPAASPTYGIEGGTFTLRVTVSGVTGLTQAIRYNADPSATDELKNDGGITGVFCETENLDGSTTPFNAACADGDSTLAGRAGSLQSSLEALPFIGVGGVVGVTRTSRLGSGAQSNEYTWTVTFSPALGGAITIVAAPGRVQLTRSPSSPTPGLIGDSGISVTTLVPGALAPAAMDAACIAPRTISGLAQGVPIYVHVLAYNSIGYGPASLSAPGSGPLIGRVGSPVAPLSTPGLPSSVGLAPASASQLRVSWGSPLDNGGDTITGYSISWGTTRDTMTGALGGAVGSLQVTYLPDAGPYTRLIPGLTAGTDYYVLVAATNSRGTGAPASTFPSFDHPRSLPASPLSVRVRVASPTSLTVGWTPPSNNGGDAVTQYLVEWDTSADFESSRRLPHRGSAVVSAATDASFTISNLAAGTAYFVRVSAANQVGFGAPSVDTPASAVPAAVVPGYPSSIGVSKSVTTCRTMLLSFSQPVVPASGVPCGGLFGAPTPCAAGTMAASGVADGGARVSSFEVHYSAYADFRDVAPGAGGSGVYIIPIAASADGTAAIQDWAVGVTNGAPLQPDSTYYVRVASRNGVGTGPFCALGGPACNGAPLVVQVPGPAAGLACPAA
jgi:hypothetical protein